MAKKAKKKPIKKVTKKINKKVGKKKQAKKVMKKVAKKAVKKVTKKTAKKVAKKTVKPKALKAVSKAVKKTTKKLTKSPIKKKVVAPKKINYEKAITPLGDRLVVRAVSKERLTPGGLIIPQTVQITGHIKGEVLAVGHGLKNKKGHIKPLDVQVGDEILFQEFAGTKVVFNSEELLIIQESEVLGIVQN